MPTSSIADEITRLSACRDDILSAISAKGVTVPVGSVLSSCPTLIASIPTGGGGTPTALINTGFWESGQYTFTQPFTATQIAVPEYEKHTSVDPRATAGGYNNLTLIMKSTELNGDPFTLVFSGNKETYLSLDYGMVYGLTGNWDPNSAIIGEYRADGTAGVNTFTLSAEIYGINTSEPYYFMFANIGTWGVTASTADVSAITTTQTGTSLPYPQYASSTTGFISASSWGMEWWQTTWNGDFSEYTSTATIHGSGACSAIYDDGPTSSISSYSEYSDTPTAFGNTYVRQFTVSHTTASLPDSNYNYVYGASASSYSSVTGLH